MPELPEVETIRRGLEQYLVGKRFISIDVRDRKIFVGDEKKLLNAAIISIERKAKGLLFNLENNVTLAGHLRMTGQFIYEDKVVSKGILFKKLLPVPSKFTRVIFLLDNGAKLFYNDVRRFSWMKVVATNMISSLPFFSALGPEPFVDLTEAQLHAITLNSKRVIKTLLMDQRKIAGLGNIYANDALFAAGIHPNRKAKTLIKQETAKLHKAILRVLSRGIEFSGATEINFVNVLGQSGTYQNHFLVYHRAGKPCVRCKTLIKKIRLGGRGTYICEVCQT